MIVQNIYVTREENESLNRTSFVGRFVSSLARKGRKVDHARARLATLHAGRGNGE